VSDVIETCSHESETNSYQLRQQVLLLWSEMGTVTRSHSLIRQSSAAVHSFRAGRGVCGLSPSLTRRNTGTHSETYQQRYLNIEDRTSSIGKGTSTTTVARVRSLVRSCAICGEQSDTGAGYLRVLRFPMAILTTQTAQHPSFYHHHHHHHHDLSSRSGAIHQNINLGNLESS
jgi:hypothetical protein